MERASSLYVMLIGDHIISLYTRWKRMSAQVRDRLTRINHLQRMHVEHPDWDEARVLKEMCVISGVRPRRIEEYIQLLKETGRW